MNFVVLWLSGLKKTKCAWNFVSVALGGMASVFVIEESSRFSVGRKAGQLGHRAEGHGRQVGDARSGWFACRG